MSPSTTLADLRRAVEALPPGSAVTLPRDVLLAALDGNGNGGHAGPTPSDTPDRLLTVREVATRMGVSPKYVYTHATDFPFTRRLSAKALRFSQSGLERWLGRVR